MTAPSTGAGRNLPAVVADLQAAGYSPERIYHEFENQEYQVNAGMAPIYYGPLANVKPQPGDVITTPYRIYTVGPDGRLPEGIPPYAQGRVYRSMMTGPFGQNA